MMIDAPDVREGWNARLWFAGVTIVLMFILIFWIVFYGAPLNALHQSALSWAFMTVLGILGAFGLGAVTDLVPWKKGV